MAKFEEKSIPYTTQVELLDSFCKKIKGLKSKEDVYNFFKDLLNRKERMMLIRRLQIAEMLEKGFTYKMIQKRLKCGCATVARVQKWLNFGRDGYKTILGSKTKKK